MKKVMNGVKTIFSIALATILLLSIVAPLTIQAQRILPAYTKRIEFVRVPLEDVPAKLGREIDVYLFGLRPAQAVQLAGRTDIKLYQAAAGLLDIILNPAPVTILKYKGKVTKDDVSKALGLPVEAINTYYSEKEGVTSIELCVKPKTIPSGYEVARDTGLKINPFCFKQVRFAMNYMVDRDFIIREIMKGFGIPMYTNYGPADPMYADIVDIVAKYRFTFDPSYAYQLVSGVLTKVGAKFEGGTWTYDGEPIKVTFIIRTEDERKDIGETVAAAIEQNLGFKVDRVMLTFGEAITRVYGTDPMEFQWHLYTEGWGRGALERWDPGMLAQFAAPWNGYMPGWQEAGYWNYRNETIDELSQKAALGLFKSKDEFLECIRKGTEMAIQESIRIWIAARTDVYAAVTNLEGVTLDLGAGLRNTVFNARNWRIAGKDTITVGHLWIWTARTAWNIFGGFTDVYSVDPERATFDPWSWRHPFNGEPIPIRVTWSVTTAGPDGKLDVPSDAIKWDPNKGWVQVGPGVNATSKVVFDLSKYLGYYWHHGVNITWADVLGYIAMVFDAAYNSTKAKIESKIASTLQTSLQPFVAFRPLIEEKKLEVYINFWHFDPNYIADYAVLNPINPIELVAAQAYLGYDKQTYALTDTRAAATKLPWLSVVLRDHAADVKKALQEMSYEYVARYTNVPGLYTMSRDEWSKRVQALTSWIDKYGSAWVSNGPYMLVLYDKDAQRLVLERFEPPAYPIRPDALYYGIPQPNVILSISVPTVSPGAEAIVTVEVSGKFPLHVIYMIQDMKTKDILYSGKVTTTREEVRIVLPSLVTAKLNEFSNYEFIVVVYGDEVTQPAEKSAILTTGLAAGAVSELRERISELEKGLQSVRESVSSVQKTTQELSTKLESVSTELRKELETQLGTVGKTVSSSLDQLAKTLSSGLSETSRSLSISITNMSKSLTELLATIAQDTTSIKQGLQQQRDLTTTLSRDIGDLRTSIDSLADAISGLKSSLNTLTTLVIVTLVLSLASVIAAVVAVIRR